MLALLAANGLSGGLSASESPTGAKIYEQKCASCHGAAGEGTKEEYPEPLLGDRTVKGLAKFIDKAMPKGSPEDCVGEEAEKVAAYVHEAFYSRAAQIRKEPPRIELSRLTVRQYRHAVADLIGSFRSSGDWGSERGLRGEYSGGRRFRDRALDRVDPTVSFDFGEGSPDQKLDAAGFSIRWTGSMSAPETGQYEFIVRTQHAARLWINDMKQPLIDAWVKSGDDTEHRATMFLLGGRVYPLKLEFSKATQGVNNNNKKKEKTKPPPVKASVKLAWKLPEQAEELIGQRHLSPKSFPETFVLRTPFPPDDRSIGYERGTAISKAWDQATTDAAIETAGYVAEHLAELSGVRGEGPERERVLRQFGRRLAERALRRPLTDDEVKWLIDGRFDGETDIDTAARRVVLLVLKSPGFLYRETHAATAGINPAARESSAARDGHAVAARISFGLFDSLPDAALLQAAAEGKLGTRDDVAKQAERLVSDRRARAKLREFLHQWLKVDQVPDLSKDPKRFADFDPAVATDLRTSLDLFLEDILASDAADFRQLLLADYVYLNHRLAKFYGIELPPDAAFQKVALDAGERAGVLSHPYLLAGFAYTATSSPIHRGVFVARSVLGRMLRPPPEAVAPLAPELHASLTTRERVELQTQPAACQRCHSLVNPLGFALERFDAVGRYRKEELGKLIDARGSYETRDGDVMKFDGVRELAKFLAQSEETHAAFVEQLFHHLVKQPVHAYGPNVLAELQKSFKNDDFNIRKLVIKIMTVAALPANPPSNSRLPP